jgi:serine/threonine protein kinase
MKFTFEPESQPLEGYTIQRALAKGGFGEVYLAKSDAGKLVALKLLRDNYEVELRGIRQCLNLKHPNLVPIYDIKTDTDGDHWIIMEYVEGRTLAEILDTRPAGLPLETVTRYLKDIAAGLSYLHDQGIVHRDLKPANIFEENGAMKIGDVGLSKFINESQRSAQTQSVGTVSYMAPEVSRGRYGKRMDVYSLGVMLYEMLSGQLPFQGDTPGEVLMRHLTEHPDLSRIPTKFRPVLARALHKDPEQRTRTVQQLVEDYEAALTGKAVAEPILDQADPQERLRAEVEQYRKEAVSSADRLRQRAYNAHYPSHVHTRSRSREEGWFKQNWYWLVIIALLFAVFVPGLLLGLFGLGLVLAPFVILMGSLGYLTYAVARKLLAKPSSRAMPGRDRRPEKVGVGPRAADESIVDTPHVSTDLRRSTRHQTGRKASVILTPDTIRNTPFQRRMAELLGSLGMAAVFSVAISGLLWWWTDSIASAMQAATLTLCLTLTSWAILTENKFLEGRHVDGFFRRLRMLVLGGLVGAVIFWLNAWLFAPLDFGSALSLDSVLRGIGPDRWLSIPDQPIADFMMYFALLFALRRWWWHTDSFRTSRVRVASLIGTFLLSILIPIFVAFPFSWSVLIATSLSAVVQLSAAWCPYEDRQPLAADEAKKGTTA